MRIVKYYFFIVVALVLFVACYSIPPQIATLNNGGKIGYNTTEIEGCEYLVFVGYHENPVTHKGNCKNPIHSHNQ